MTSPRRLTRRQDWNSRLQRPQAEEEGSRRTNTPLTRQYNIDMTENERLDNEDTPTESEDVQLIKLPPEGELQTLITSLSSPVNC